MEYLFGFVIFSIVAFLVAIKLFPHEITIKEVCVGICIQATIIAIVFFGSLYGKGHDIMILNGKVISKYKDKVSCEHSYSCNCITSCSGSGSSRSCYTVCQTCYEHSHDFDWVVDSTVGTLTINRIDRQGVDEPSRYTKVVIGEPFAKESSYFNYIKAAPLTLFDKKLLQDVKPVPNYIGVHDYYRINRVIVFGSEYKTSWSVLNEELNNALRELGNTKKVNIVVVVHNKDKNFVEQFKAKLYGGKINDVVVMIKPNEEGVLQDVSVFSWSKDSLVDIKIRDSILDSKSVVDQVQLAKNIVDNISAHYKARDIEEFKYLEASIEAPDSVILFIWIFGLLFPFIWSYIAHKHLDI